MWVGCVSVRLMYEGFLGFLVFSFVFFLLQQHIRTRKKKKAGRKSGATAYKLLTEF